MEIEVIIDSLTNCLICTKTGQECDTEYRLVAKTITKRNALELKAQGWKFDWSVPHKNGYEVYELLLEDDEEVQGRIYRMMRTACFACCANTKAWMKTHGARFCPG